MLSGIIMLLYTVDSVNGVISPVLVVLGDLPAVLLILLYVLILFKYEKGVEISMASPAQFEIAAEEAPATPSALCVAKSLAEQRVMQGRRVFLRGPFYTRVLRAVETVTPSSEFMRGCLRFPFSVERLKWERGRR